MTPTVLDLDVRPNDLDALGHVNHATAVEYLETGRWGFVRRNGLRPTPGVVPVVTRLEVDYARELLAERVRVHTRLAEPPLASETNFRVTFLQTIHPLTRDASDTSDEVREEEAAVWAVVNVGFVDVATRRLCTAQVYLGMSPREE